MSPDLMDVLQHATNSIDYNTGNICIHYGIKLRSHEMLAKKPAAGDCRVPLLCLRISRGVLPFQMLCPFHSIVLCRAINS